MLVISEEVGKLITVFCTDRGNSLDLNARISAALFIGTFTVSDNKSHLRQTTQKTNPLPETVDKIRKSIVWKMENELYNFALDHFHSVKKRLINASQQDLNQHFMYEKIRPK